MKNKKIIVFSPQSTISSTLIGRTLKFLEKINSNNIKIFCLHGSQNNAISEIVGDKKINYYGKMLVEKTKDKKNYYPLSKVIYLFLLATFKEAWITINNIQYKYIYFVKNQPLHILPAIISKIMGKKIIGLDLLRLMIIIFQIAILLLL